MQNIQLRSYKGLYSKVKKVFHIFCIFYNRILNYHGLNFTETVINIYPRIIN